MASEERKNLMPDLSKQSRPTNGSGIAGSNIGNGDAGDVSANANTGDTNGAGNATNGIGNGSAGNGASSDSVPMQVPKPSGPIPVKPSEERMQKANAAFERFKDLQVDPQATVAARRIITTCTVRRPKKNEFVRVNVDDEKLYTGYILEDKDEDTFYIIKDQALQYLYDLPPLKMLVLTVNQKGGFFLWPVPTDDRNMWNESSRKAYQIAKSQWVKLVGDRGEGLYHTYLAEGELPPPRWPDKTYWELVDLAFPNSKVVKDADHEVVLKARTGQARK
jgi:hypothetical protein